MRFDDKPLKVLDRKLGRLAEIGAARRYDVWLDELPNLLRWILSEPVSRTYAKAIMRMHEQEEAAFMHDLEAGIDAIAKHAAKFRAECKTPSEQSDGWGPQTWENFDAYAEVKRSDETSEQRCTRLNNLLVIVRGHAHQAGTDVSAAHRKADETVSGLENAVQIASESGDVAAHDDAKARLQEAIRERDAAHALYERTLDLVGPINATEARYRKLLHGWKQKQTTSPRTALIDVVNLCRALDPPIDDDVPHWTDLVPRATFNPYRYEGKRAEDAALYSKAVIDLGRVADELHALAGSTLSNITLVQRFSERCAWYDKDRLRQVAATGSGTEDRLTLELAKYLHDSGLLVFVRPRVSNFEPDIVGVRGLAIEAKAHRDTKNARRDIKHGFYQLHAYMTALESEALLVREGFVVIFRLDGPIYETDPTIDTGRFLIHSLTIDLGLGTVSGRKQPQTRRIKPEEIFEFIAHEGEKEKAIRKPTRAARTKRRVDPK